MKRANNFEITGNCVADAKIIICGNNREKAIFSVAVNHLYNTTSEGEKQTVPEYFNVETWDKKLFPLIKKGATVTVKGFRKGCIVKEKPYFFIVSTKIEKFVPEIVTLSQDSDRMEESDETQAMLKQLYRMINRLGPLEKSIILLYLEEKSYEEIAEITGLTVTNVATKISRIKDKLRKMNKEE